jgi:thiamine pyrophosphokinase
MAKKALIFANGDVNDGEFVRILLRETSNATVIAADGGARVAKYYGLIPHTIIGDMDSVDPLYLEELQNGGTIVKRHDPEKDETDLHLALLYAVQNGAEWIRIIGALGGRLDQTLSNVYLLALRQLEKCDVRIVSGKQEAWLMRPGINLIQGRVGDTMSLIPVSGVAAGVRTENLQYALNDEELLFGPTRGVSNVMAAEQAQVYIREGVLLAVHIMGKA